MSGLRGRHAFGAMRGVRTVAKRDKGAEGQGVLRMDCKKLQQKNLGSSDIGHNVRREI